MKRKILGLFVVLLLLLNQQAMAMVQYGPTKAGESLYEIAKKHRPAKGVSAEKMVLVIKTLNPQAVKGNEVTKGSYLRIPVSKAEVEQVFRDPAAALAIPVTKPAKNNETKTVKAAADVSAAKSSVPVTAPSAAVVSVDQAPVTKPPKPVPPPAPIIIKDQAAIDELKKTVDFEHSARLKVEEKADQLESTLKAGEDQIRALEEESANLKGSFPWSWVWFLSFFGLCGYFVYTKRQNNEPIFSGARFAAARLGVTRTEPPGSKIQSYPTKRFDDSYQQYSMDRKKLQEGHGAALAGAMIDIAEGNGSAAELKLKAQIEKEPANVELRMKLLEVYIEQNNREKFKELADDLLANLISEEDPEWARIQAIYLSKWVYD